MGDDRLSVALGRIERAVARLEALDSRPAAAAPPADGLAAAHEALRGRVEQAIGQIDRLLSNVEAR
ncbi:MAG TPA: hypothetical protein VF727_08850 [Allosphingosinicella sp.]|jgi:hypothetical protein